jgi:hypothetical protein
VAALIAACAEAQALAQAQAGADVDDNDEDLEFIPWDGTPQVAKVSS